MLRPLRVLASAVAVLSISAVGASPASAGLLVASAPACDAQSTSQVFLPWVDPMNYVLSPGGDFESSASWSTTGSASIVSGNEPWKVGGESHSSSLSLSSGGSAQSGVMCVGIEHPTVRFFARQTGGSTALGHIDVDVLFEDSLGNVREMTVASVGAGSSWAPTAAYPLVVSLLPLLPGSHTPVAFRLTARDGSFEVDDFYVDPYNRG